MSPASARNAERRYEPQDTHHVAYGSGGGRAMRIAKPVSIRSATVILAVAGALFAAVTVAKLRPSSVGEFLLMVVIVQVPFVIVWWAHLLGIKVLEFRRKRRRLANQCTHCEYDLSGNVSGVCPECGTPIRGRSRVLALWNRHKFDRRESGKHTTDTLARD